VAGAAIPGAPAGVASPRKKSINELVRRLSVRCGGGAAGVPGRRGEPVLEIEFVDQGRSAGGIVAGDLGLHRARQPQRIQHLLHELRLYGCCVPAEFMHRAQQPAVLGNAGSLNGGGAELVAEQAHDLVVRLQQGFVQQRGAGLAQMRMGFRGGQRGEPLAVTRHAQLLQRPQRNDNTARRQ
jgi:hypothetical protein